LPLGSTAMPRPWSAVMSPALSAHKKIGLAMRSAKIRSRRMKTAVKSPNPARFWRPAEHSSFQSFSFQHFSSTQIPLFPRNPLFPRLRSGHPLFLRPSPQK
jgi:hypothetical protein